MITGRTPGTAKITITANYSGYSSTRQAFNVSVTDVTGVVCSVSETTTGSAGTSQINKITVPNNARLGAYEVKKIAVGSGAELGTLYSTVTTAGAVDFTMNDFSTTPAVNVSIEVTAGDTAATIAANLINAIKINSNFLSYYNSFNLNTESGNIIVLTSKIKQTDKSLRMSIIDTGTTGVGNSNSYTGIIGAAPGDGNISFQVNDGTINQTLTIIVADGDSAATVAQKILIAANANSTISNAYLISIENGSTLVLSSTSNQINKTVTLTISDNDTGVGSLSTSTANTTGVNAIQEVNTLTITHEAVRSGVFKLYFQ